MTEVNSKKESSSTKTIPFVQKSSFSPAISQIKHHRQSQKKKRMSQIKIYSPDYIQSLLEKTKGTRTKIEIRINLTILSFLPLSRLTRNAAMINPIINPPVAPVITPKPPLNPENTGTPIAPSATYTPTDSVPNL